MSLALFLFSAFWRLSALLKIIITATTVAELLEQRYKA